MHARMHDRIAWHRFLKLSFPRARTHARTRGVKKQHVLHGSDPCSHAPQTHTNTHSANPMCIHNERWMDGVCIKVHARMRSPTIIKSDPGPESVSLLSAAAAAAAAAAMRVWEAGTPSLWRVREASLTSRKGILLLLLEAWGAGGG